MPYRDDDWDNFTGIPTATPSNGDTTHLSTADHIYDWVISLGYLTSMTNIFDQWLNTTSAVTFATVDTGQGANELYDMNQNVQTTDSPTFAGVTVKHFKIDTVNITCLNSGCNWYSNATDSCMYWPSGGRDCGS